MSDLEHWIDLLPAHDCTTKCAFGKSDCVKGAGGWHGIGAVRMFCYARGSLGVVQFVLFTAWHLDETNDRLWSDQSKTRDVLHTLSSPMAADLGYHSPKPMWEGQEHHGRDDCYLLDGTCYYDGSGLNAEEPWRALREGGSAALWEYMDGYYAKVFGEPDDE